MMILSRTSSNVYIISIWHFSNYLVLYILVHYPTALTSWSVNWINGAIHVHSERVRDEVMQHVAGPSDWYLNQKSPAIFVEFCSNLVWCGGLRWNQWAPIEEHVAKLLWFLGSNTRYNACWFLFHRSSETRSHQFRKVTEEILS